MSRLSLTLASALVLVLLAGSAWYWLTQTAQLEAELARVRAELMMERRAAAARASAVQQARDDAAKNAQQQAEVWNEIGHADRGSRIDPGVLRRLREAGFLAPGVPAE